jgi:hypothetical protein
MAMTDPFSTLGNTDGDGTVAVEDAPQNTAAADTGDILDDLDWDLEELEDEEEHELRSNFIRPRPSTVLPARVVGAKLVEAKRATKICIVRVKGPDGKVRIVSQPKRIEEAIKAGGTEEVVEKMIPQLEIEVVPVAPIYGERPWPYKIFVNTYTVKISWKKGERTGFTDNGGYNFRKACGIATNGQLINAETLPQIAESMIGKYVMVQVKYSKSEKDVVSPRLDDNGQPIKGLIDQHGNLVTVTKDGEAYVYTEDKTPVPDAVVQNLVEHNGDYAIRDDSEDSYELQVVTKEPKIYDNLDSKAVRPVPDRNIEISRADGTDVLAEVTLDTVAFMVKCNAKGYMVDGIAINTLVQAVTDGGELLTARWTGTAWMETEQDYNLTLVESLGEDREEEGVAKLVAVGGESTSDDSDEE